jgi:hypothetical protein
MGKERSHVGWKQRGNVRGQRRDRDIETAFTGNRRLTFRSKIHHGAAVARILQNIKAACIGSAYLNFCIVLLICLYYIKSILMFVCFDECKVAFTEA